MVPPTGHVSPILVLWFTIWLCFFSCHTLMFKPYSPCLSIGPSRSLLAVQQCYMQLTELCSSKSTWLGGGVYKTLRRAPSGCCAPIQTPGGAAVLCLCFNCIQLLTHHRTSIISSCLDFLQMVLIFYGF